MFASCVENEVCLCMCVRMKLFVSCVNEVCLCRV